MMDYTATYSPEDNKLRLYSLGRLPSDLYARVRAAGFIYAPKQELFVAPMWTPDREDLLLELCGEIGDEDKSLVERAEERADRFRDYSQHRAQDADQAHKAVAAIADNIPLGQPILVGHHSERRARKDAERIENGMRRAVKMWETAEYWKDRARGAIGAAKYKERPDVRARRIKKLEAEKRGQERSKAKAELEQKFWRGEMHMTNKETGERKPFTISEENRALIVHTLGNSDMGNGSYCFPLAKYPRQAPASQYEGAMSIWGALGGSDGPEHAICTLEQARNLSLATAAATIARCERWLAHYDNRLAYEKAMLEAEGASDLLKPAPRSKLLPLLNYRQKTIAMQSLYQREPMVLEQVEMTSEEYARINKDYKGTHIVEHSHRVRSAMVHHSLVAVFLTDSKVHEKPAPQDAPEIKQRVYSPAPYIPPPRTKFDDMKDSLKVGVQVVTAPNLFPTPPSLAERMAEIAFEHGWGVQVCAEMNDRCRILEPSAGTGNIVDAIRKAGEATASTLYELVCIEINSRLVDAMKLRRNQEAGKDFSVLCSDFLTCNGSLGKFDRILMNPPFDHGSDIAHIKHAMTFLAPGGRLVAICANGPRQQEELQPLSSQWIDLEPGTFKDQGTNVNTALIVIDN